VRPLAEVATRDSMDEFDAVSSGLDCGFPSSFAGGARPLPLAESIVLASSEASG
jgi:hypothetical protein